MNSLTLSYANALDLVITENGKDPSSTLKELEDVYSAFDEQIKKFLYSKVVKASDKKEILKNALKGVYNDIVSFIFVLIDNNRIDKMEDIIKSYKMLLDEKKNIINVDVIVSSKLKEDEKIKIKEKINEKFFNNSTKEIVINEIIDESIMKGLVIKYKNKTLDASLYTKQVSLKEFLEK